MAMSKKTMGFSLFFTANCRVIVVNEVEGAREKRWKGKGWEEERKRKKRWKGKRWEEERKKEEERKRKEESAREKRKGSKKKEKERKEEGRKGKIKISFFSVAMKPIHASHVG
jgi:hypothetical protein